MPLEMEDRGKALENEYFRRKEDELIAKLKAKLAAEGAQPTGTNCPKCDGALKETGFREITIDVCDKCTGIWLDAGELAQIVDSDEDGGWFGELLK